MSTSYTSLVHYEGTDVVQICYDRLGASPSACPWPALSNSQHSIWENRFEVVDYSPDFVLLQATAGIAVRDNMATAAQSSARRCRSKRHGEWPLAVGLVAEVEVLVWWSIRNMASVNIVECMLRFWSMSRPANRQLGCKIELNGTLASVDVEQRCCLICGTFTRWAQRAVATRIDQPARSTGARRLRASQGAPPLAAERWRGGSAGKRVGGCTPAGPANPPGRDQCAP